MTEPVRTPRDRFDRLLALARRTARFWLVVAVTTIVGTTGAIAVALVRPRTYRSETLILYRQGIREAEFGEQSSTEAARKLGLKLKEMVLSRSRLQQIIEEFKLYPKIVDDRGYVDAVDEMRNHITFRTRDGDTFGLSFDGDDPKRVQHVTAKLAEALIDENSKDKADQANTTRDFLDTEKKKTETELRAKESELARFLTSHPEFARETSMANALKGKPATPGPGKDPTLMALERQAQRLEERLGAPPTVKVKHAPDADPQLVAARDKAQNEVDSAQRDLDTKRNQFTERHPDVLAAKARLERAEEKLRLAQDMLAAASPKSEPPEPPPSEADRAQLQADLQKIKGEIAEYRARKARADGNAAAATPASDANRIVALETDFERLSREVSEARDRQRSLEDKQFKANMQAKSLSSGASQMVVVDPAYLPTHPSKGSRSTIAAVSLASSLLLGLLLAVGCALLDDRLYDAVDVENLGRLPLLVVVPKEGKKPRRTSLG